MVIKPHGIDSDDKEFLDLVRAFATGVLDGFAPGRLYLIHIDNWFDRKWLEFSGTTGGQEGIWKDEEHLTIPPFVPNRVLSQQAWRRDADAGSYVAEDCAPAIHVAVESGANLQRRVSAIVPDSALIWYSGNTAPNRRGSIMAYIPDRDGYRRWYVELLAPPEWKVSTLKGTTREEFNLLSRRC